MSDEKILSSEETSEATKDTKYAEVTSKKTLTSDSSDPGKTIDSDFQEKSPPKKDEQPEALTGATIQERIENSTRAGGLKSLPPNFDDSDGDWKIIKSNNVFERLYLDCRQYQSIKPATVESNFQLLKGFWEQKISAMQTGANKFKIVKKYAGIDGSERTILNYKKQLQEAYEQLSKTNGIESTYKIIEEQRIRTAREILEPDLLTAMEDNVLEHSEERLIKNKARRETELTELEINEFIEEYLKKTGSIRGEGGSGMPVREKHLLHNIKKVLKDKFLSLSDEEELLVDSAEFEIPPKIYDKLIIQALREIDDSEREKTFETDKKNFREYYFSLLKNYGLTSDDRLPDEAAKRLSERDGSETDFFPLSQKTRRNLIKEETASYTEKHIDEKKRFYDEAMQKLDKYDGHIEQKEVMQTDAKYELLLPQVRTELLDAAIDQIIENQSNGYLNAVKKLHQQEKWHVSDHLKDQFLIALQNVPGFENVRSDWLDRDRFVNLFTEGETWAQEQYQNEMTIFKSNLNQELKKYIYGLPVDIQEKLEQDQSLYLDQAERRQFVIEIEKSHRKDAVKKLYDLVEKALVFETLIPDVEKKLLETGENELLLTTGKNDVSFQVKTAVEIIAEKRKDFNTVLSTQISDLYDSRKLDEALIHEYNLQHNAYITLPEIEDFVSQYKPANTSERKTVFASFEAQAKNAGLHIILEDADNEFEDVLIGAMEKTSAKYKYSLKKWLTETFISNMIKVGAAHGVREDNVRAQIDSLKSQYPEWTRPKWKRFFKYFLIITGLFTLFRLTISVTGYPDWLFTWSEMKRYAMYNLLDTIEFSDVQRDNMRHDQWVIFYVFFTLFLIVYRMAKSIHKSYEKKRNK